MNQMQHKLWRVENDMESYKNSLEDLEKRYKQDHYEFLAYQMDINMAVTPSNDNIVPHENLLNL